VLNAALNELKKDRDDRTDGNEFETVVVEWSKHKFPHDTVIPNALIEFSLHRAHDPNKMAPKGEVDALVLRVAELKGCPAPLLAATAGTAQLSHEIGCIAQRSHRLRERVEALERQHGIATTATAEDCIATRSASKFDGNQPTLVAIVEAKTSANRLSEDLGKCLLLRDELAKLAHTTCVIPAL
jgi:hypothetical protein